MIPVFPDSSVKRDFSFNNISIQNGNKIPVFEKGKLPVPKASQQGLVAFEKDLSPSQNISGKFYYFNGTIWVSVSGDISLAAVGTNSNVNAATLTNGNILNLEPANATFPGVVTAGTQTFGGDKTFTGTISAANLSGNNFGDLILNAADNAAANANIKGATMTLGSSGSPQQLNLNAAALNFPGIISVDNINTQTLGSGSKKIEGDIIVTKNMILPMTADSTHGVLIFDGPTKKMRLHGYSSFPSFSQNIFLGEDAGNFTNNASINIGIGAESLKKITTGTTNICLSSGNQLTTGIGNILLIGGGNITTSNNNVIIGLEAAQDLSRDGGGNVILGYQAMRNYLPSFVNAAFNKESVCIGKEVGKNIGDGNEKNVLIGARALINATQSYSNVIIGSNACPANTAGFCTVLGAEALLDSNYSNNDVAIGDHVAKDVLHSESNVYIGKDTGGGAIGCTRTNCTYIGNGLSDNSPDSTNIISLGVNINDLIPISNRTYVDNVYNITPADTVYGPVVVSNKDQLGSLSQWPGTSTASYLLNITPMSIVSNVAAVTLNLGASAFTPAITQLTKVGDTVVVNETGIYEINFHIHGDPDASYFCKFLVNSVQSNSESRYMGPAILGVETDITFYFMTRLTAGNIMSFQIASKTNGGGNAALNGTAQLWFKFTRSE